MNDDGVCRMSAPVVQSPPVSSVAVIVRLFVVKTKR